MLLQKLFSAFPGGWPGFGLLLLRVLVAVMVIVETITYVRSTETVAGWSIVALLLASAVSLLLGFLTPIVVILLAATALVLAFSTTSLQYLELAVLAVVVALLGPGAFSIDARMFGHREIFIPVTPKALTNFSSGFERSDNFGE